METFGEPASDSFDAAFTTLEPEAARARLRA
jgi:hypothetical protein